MLEILYQPVDSFVEDSYRELKDQIKETIIPYLAHNSDDKRLDKLILEFYASILNTLQAEVYINKYLFPAMDAIKYCLMNLHVDKYIQFLKKHSKRNEKAGDLSILHCWLRSYDYQFQHAIIRSLNLNFALSSKLLNTLKEDKYDIFEDTIIKYDIDLTDAIEICELHQSYLFKNESKNIFRTYSKKIGNTKFVTSPISFNLKIGEKEINFELFRKKFADLKIKFKNIDDIFSTIDQADEIIEAKDNDINALICIIYTHFSLLDEIDIKLISDRLSNGEFELFNSYYQQLINALKFVPVKEENIVTKSFLAELINNERKKFSSSSITELIDDIEKSKFVLPEDLFKQNEYLTYHDKNEFYNLNHDLTISKSPDLLCKLINELADWGFINNDNETKTLFAYRFTGKKILRPVELKAIQWNEQGRSKRGYSLLHLIKKLTYDTGTYSKVKEFFTGIEWGEKLNEDANEKNASIRFKRLLHKVSPEDFTNPDKK